MIGNVHLTKKRWNNIDKTYINWSEFGTFSLALTPAKESTNVAATHRIEELLQKLTQVPKVKEVRAIALKDPDIHWIDFELELQPETELSHEEWENVQNLVIDCEWKLRDDSGEKWYFHAEPVTRFSPLRDGSRVINHSDDRQPQSTGKKILSSNFNLYSELITAKNYFTQK